MQTDEFLEEFICDANELIDIAEKLLLQIEGDCDKFVEVQQQIFNSLHSLKGSLGMFGYSEAVKEAALSASENRPIHI